LIGETEDGRLYRNNRPGREEIVFPEIKTPKTTVRYHDEINSMDIDFEPLELERTVAYLQKYSKDERKARNEKKDILFPAFDLAQATGPEDIGKAGTDLAIPSDVTPTPFVNYKRPVTSPYMEVKVPHDTETGIVMPPLPEHVCDPPKAVITHADKWEKKNSSDEVVEPDGSVFTCMCGKNWYVRVQKVPFHISEYDPQYVYNWKPVRWFQFGRKSDIRKRREQ
jgi:hypothetical protein